VVFNAEQRVPKGHLLRRIKALADAALAQLSPRFDGMYSTVGRPSIPPEKASLLAALYTVHSERMFCEQLDYNLLFRWLLEMDVTEPSFNIRLSRATARGCWSTRWQTSFSGRWWHGPVHSNSLGRALHRRRNADRGLGFVQKLQAQGCETA
jgi:hypothetical protein